MFGLGVSYLFMNVIYCMLCLVEALQALKSHCQQIDDVVPTAITNPVEATLKKAYITRCTAVIIHAGVQHVGNKVFIKNDIAKELKKAADRDLKETDFLGGVWRRAHNAQRLKDR